MSIPQSGSLGPTMSGKGAHAAMAPSVAGDALAMGEGSPPRGMSHAVSRQVSMPATTAAVSKAMLGPASVPLLTLCNFPEGFVLRLGG